MCCVAVSDATTTTTCTSLTATDALLVIDVQNSFLPTRPVQSFIQPSYAIPADQIVNGSIVTGSLGVTSGGEVVPVINDWMNEFTKAGAKVFASLDWHPVDSCSFCSENRVCAGLGVTHCGTTGDLSADCPKSLLKRCSDPVSISEYNSDQYVQWPVHCAQQTFGSRFDPYLKMPATAIVVKKGFDVTQDSYSAFGGRLSKQTYPFDTEDTSSELATQPSLKDLLEQNQIERLWVVGIATDYCVKNSILDAMGRNVMGDSTRPSTVKDVVLVSSAVRGVAPDTSSAAVDTVRDAGAFVLAPSVMDVQLALSQFCSATASTSNSDSGKLKVALYVVGSSLALALLGLVYFAYQLRATRQKQLRRRRSGAESEDAAEMEEGEGNQSGTNRDPLLPASDRAPPAF